MVSGSMDEEAGSAMRLLTGRNPKIVILAELVLHLDPTSTDLQAKRRGEQDSWIVCTCDRDGW